MIENEVIIIGAGPAGSACAWKLVRAGRNVLILDKATFPRLKLCAGWITPRVPALLRFNIREYPHSILEFNKLYFHFYGKKIALPTKQYSIRRTEFDAWLLQRSGAEFIRHQVKEIREDGGHFIIDETYRCRYLVGAGGTNDPVYRTFFKSLNPRSGQKRVVSIEEEFAYDYKDNRCLLWFFDYNLSGYSWYVPKGAGYLNVGIGAKYADLKAKGQNLRLHWERFIKKLSQKGLVTGHSFKTKGYQYYLHDKVTVGQIGTAYLIGDAAGLATVDMGEGIGPAVESGLLAAGSILYGKPFQLLTIPRYSLPALLFPRRSAKQAAKRSS